MQGRSSGEEAGRTLLASVGVEGAVGGEGVGDEHVEGRGEGRGERPRHGACLGLGLGLGLGVRVRG